MSRYKTNDTMKILAKQSMAEVAAIAPAAPTEIKDIMTANGMPNEFIGSNMLNMA